MEMQIWLTKPFGSDNNRFDGDQASIVHDFDCEIIKSESPQFFGDQFDFVHSAIHKEPLLWRDTPSLKILYKIET